MLTQCPECSTVFRLHPEQLKAAQGKVRCGECQTVFDALDHLREAPPPSEAEAPAPEAPATLTTELPPEEKPREKAPSVADIQEMAYLTDDTPDFGTLLVEGEETAPPAMTAPEESTATAEDETIAPAEADSDATLLPDLEQLFPADEEEEPAAIVEDIPPTPSEAATAAPMTELFGEDQIEALLKTDEPDIDLPELDLDIGGTEDAPANGASTAQFDIEDSHFQRITGDLTNLEIDRAADTVGDFDLPEPQLTSAQPQPATPPPELPPILADAPATGGRSLGASLGWSLLSLLLLALLAGQYAYLDRNNLVRHAELRPWLEQMCLQLRCELPARRDLAAITLLDRDIRSHDTLQGALVISATLVNRALFPQPYPVVEVAMRDLGGNTVAARRFLPAEYMAATGGPLLASQGTARLRLEVLDPGAEAVGFEFTFY